VSAAPKKSICAKDGWSATSVIFAVDGQTRKSIIMARQPIGTLVASQYGAGPWVGFELT